MRNQRPIGLAFCIVVAALPIGTGARADAPVAQEFFEKEVRPLLVENCLKCHGDKKPKGGLSLTSRAAILKGGDTGAAAVEGKPDESLLIQAVRYNEKPQMPPKKKLTERQIATLTRWVQLGLPWPKAGGTIAAEAGDFQIREEQRRFWSFQPMKNVAPPAVRDAAWAKSDVDRFILAALEAKGLHPAKRADKRTLLRRAAFDLTGLPPTPEEMETFLRDDRSDAFARAVDRLLASPAYGERWGRHWLDLVRYTDSFDARGIGGEMDCADAWRYRDWVVRAFNNDLPYDRFLTDQIAGDLVPARGGFNRDGIIATGLLALGNWGGGDADKEKLLTDIADDQVDVVSRTFMGLTMACARCHDHKFDPLSTADYYGLAGIFFSTHILPNVGPKTNGPPMLRIPLLSPEELARREQSKKNIAEREKRIKESKERYYREFARTQLDQTAKYLVAAWEREQSPSGDLTAFARGKGLHANALRRWIDYLGLGDYPLMNKPVRDVLGRAGVHGWKGEPDCPSLLVNTTDREVSLLTFKLPPRAVSVHPGPTNGVVVAWRSPVAGTVRIKGRLLDADPVGGDGVAWAIDRRAGAARSELASGDLGNGGAQRFEQGKGAEPLANIPVAAGDRLELLVLPKANHGFDTTVVEWEIATTDGASVWDLARDVVADPHQGNPHGDRHGRAAVWSFHDMANHARNGRPNTGPELKAWDQAVADVRADKRDRRALDDAARDFAKTFTLTDARSPFWITNSADEQYLTAEARQDLAKQATELETLKKTPLPPIEYANGGQEGGVPGSPHAGTHDVRIHMRGRYDRLGPLVPRRFPEILAGREQKPIASGSGRLELARWLTRPDHPLTARVMVNRIWQQHFGEGIVRTPSNFGKLGRPPTHPELLDFLAREFARSGWSIKHMHRLLMLSAVYQESSDAPDTLKSDPDNLLFGRANRRRLEAEALRDSVLAVSGRLDRGMGGPAVRDFAVPRRTLYLMTIRSDRSGFGPLFDSADPTAPIDKRTISTVAPQALFLLNNPFMLAQTQALARRILAAEKEEGARIKRVYSLLYGRPPSGEELVIGRDFLKRAGGGEQAWQEYGEILLCANEFMYVD
ncbi:MAG TPA: PSD1 and planctomycete cytochrome C domain-containing protein [Gemmataceae bacterium]|jgi:mono/diheme cytochrome c family protein